MSDAPRRIAIVVNEEQLHALNSLYYLGLCFRDDSSARETEIGLTEVKKVPQGCMAEIAKKLFHATQTLGRKKNA